MIEFRRVGRVERFRRYARGYVWFDAWSDGTVPWLTYREAQAAARAQGKRAKFVRTS